MFEVGNPFESLFVVILQFRCYPAVSLFDFEVPASPGKLRRLVVRMDHPPWLNQSRFT